MSNKTSVKSTALEQRVSLGQDGLGPWLMQIITRYGLLLLCIALAGYAQRRRLLNQKAVQRSQAASADNNNQKAINP
ncbi:hypothetical protein A6U95_09570 [Serratia sp. 14-2641]|nr:hypothetical protein A6U95_09570 [Serratia sp. 14-2641]